MAHNEYSRRSSKNVFWTDNTENNTFNEPQPDSTQTISYDSQTLEEPIQETNTILESEQSTPSLFSDTTNNFDIDRFVKNNDTSFSAIIIAKIFTQILFLINFISIFVTYDYRICIVPAGFMLIIGYYITEFIFNKIYISYVKKAALSNKIIKVFNEKPKKSLPWRTMLKFPIGIKETSHIDYELCIDATKTTVNFQKIYFTKEMGKQRATFLTCDCYKANIQKSAPIATNINLIRGKVPFVKREKYYRHVSQYYSLYSDSATNIEECNMTRICNIANKLIEHLGNNKSFAMFFNGNNIYLTIPTENVKSFQYQFFNYSITDRIRKEIAEITNKIYISDLLSKY